MSWPENADARARHQMWLRTPRNTLSTWPSDGSLDEGIVSEPNLHTPSLPAKSGSECTTSSELMADDSDAVS